MKQAGCLTGASWFQALHCKLNFLLMCLEKQGGKPKYFGLPYVWVTRIVFGFDLVQP